MASQPQGTGTFCWVELLTRDVAAAKKFYGELVGWKLQEDPNLTAGRPYTLITPPGGEQSIGGMMTMEGEQFANIPPHWLTYIMVDDVDAKTKQVPELGGKVHCGPFDIPNVGRFSVIQDPSGATVALFQGK
jgi:predicted enzyme related to lactoylglutathione lyase